MKKLNIIKSPCNKKEYNAVMSLEQAATLLLEFKSIQFTLDDEIDPEDDPEGWHGAVITRPLDFDMVSIGYLGGDYEYRGYHLNNAAEYPEDYDLDTTHTTKHAAVTAMLYQYVCAYSETDDDGMLIVVSLDNPKMRKMAAAFTDPSEFERGQLNPDLDKLIRIGDAVLWRDPAAKKTKKAQEEYMTTVYHVLKHEGDGYLLKRQSDGAEIGALKSEMKKIMPNPWED